VIYHDAIFGDIHVSQDEGKSWKRADDIPPGEAAMFIEHPFDNRVVRYCLYSYSQYILSASNVLTMTFDLTEFYLGIRINKFLQALPHRRPRKVMAHVRSPRDGSLRPKSTLIPLRSQKVGVHPPPGYQMRPNSLGTTMSRRGAHLSHIYILLASKFLCRHTTPKMDLPHHHNHS
jgi:hypothetical protein